MGIGRTSIDISPKVHKQPSKYMNKLSTSLIITKMQIKTTMRYHLTPNSLAIKKNYILPLEKWNQQETSKWRKIEAQLTAGRNINGTAHVKNNVVLQEVKHRNYHIIWQFHSQVYVKRSESRDSNRCLYTHVHSIIIHNSKKTETTK